VARLSADDFITEQLSLSIPWKYMAGSPIRAALPALIDDLANTGMILRETLRIPPFIGKAIVLLRTGSPSATDGCEELDATVFDDVSSWDPDESITPIRDLLSDRITWPYASIFATSNRTGRPGITVVCFEMEEVTLSDL
jgi:hypothetical protein